MTTFEDVHRQKLQLVVDNPHPRRREESFLYRMGTFAGFCAAAGFALGCWWLVVTLVFSLG